MSHKQKEHYDAVVIGAGPAGATAAMTMARDGLQVAIIDENLAAGGQVWRAPAASIILPPAQRPSAGQRLRDDLNRADVDTFFDTRLWHVETRNPGFRCFATVRNSAVEIETRSLILATGAQERILPVPGWTIPGVIGLGAATALLKSQKIVPGQNLLIAGAGPLLFVVAHEILRLGASIAGIVDYNRKRDWLKTAPNLALRPDQALLGLNWLRVLMARRIPYYSGHGIRCIQGTHNVTGVEIGPLDKDWAPVGQQVTTIEADSVAYGHGLVPANEYARYLGASFGFDDRQDSWQVQTDVSGRTRVKGLYVTGDGAGISGALAAQSHGQMTAAAAICDLAKNPAPFNRPKHLWHRLAYKNAAQLGRAMNAMTRPRSGILAPLGSDTVICRCEDVTKAQIEQAIAAGNKTANALKSTTRCGMGPCGGRFCQEALSRLIALNTGTHLTSVPLSTPRTPFRPLPMTAIAGDFDYSDLPLSKPAPL